MRLRAAAPFERRGAASRRVARHDLCRSSGGVAKAGERCCKVQRATPTSCAHPLRCLARASSGRASTTLRPRRGSATPARAAVVEGSMRLTCDFLVIGSGIAGLSFALEAAEHGEVIVVTKRAREESNTKYAQGGIAAVLDAADSFDAHVSDTMVAGAGLNHLPAVELTVKDAPARIAMLRRAGAKFDLSSGGAHADESSPSLAHRQRTRVRSADSTRSSTSARLEQDPRSAPRGRPQRAPHRALGRHDGQRGRARARRRRLREEEHPRARGAHGHRPDHARQVRRAGGLRRRVRARRRQGKVVTILARATVLATGGAGKVYLYTTNPDVATGDGIAMAFRAGAEVANMEFFQFHPTCLFHPQAKDFLISEALRGEGAVLRRLDGTPFMKEHHPRAELAPRDIVARAIDHEMKRSGAEHVLLDITHKDAAFVKEHFPGHLRAVHALRDRHHPPADPGRAGGALSSAVASRPISKDAPPSPASGRSASARTRGSTARTASPRTRCSRGWSSRIAPPRRSRSVDR